MESNDDEAAAKLAKQISLDYRTAALTEQQLALCDYAVRLTVSPTSHDEAALDGLRQTGLTDEQISLATQIVGYFNYINRVANGLGVDPEPWMTLTKQQWLASKAKFSLHRDQIIRPALHVTRPTL